MREINETYSLKGRSRLFLSKKGQLFPVRKKPAGHYRAERGTCTI